MKVRIIGEQEELEQEEKGMTVEGIAEQEEQRMKVECLGEQEEQGIG